MSADEFRRTSYLTEKEVATTLRVSLRTVSDWRRGKKLPFFKIGRVVRFHPRSVAEFIEARTLKARFVSGQDWAGVRGTGVGWKGLERKGLNENRNT